MNALGFFGLAWCVLSLVFLYRACAFLWSERQFGRTCVTTSGKVVGEERKTRKVSSSSGGRREVSFSFPVIMFRTNDGREIRATPQVNVAKALPVGATVDVGYLPADPDRIRVVGDSVARHGPRIAAGVGALFFLAGVGILTGAIMSGG